MSEQSPTRQPASVGEFELIAALKRMIDASAPSVDVVIGIGDDAAAVSVRAGTHVMTTDTMVDGIHFRRGEADWADVGWKSAVSNLSDIAAMGATPLHALVTIGVPRDIAVDEIEKMYGGLGEVFSEFGGGIVGGDVVSSPIFFVTVALTGHAKEIDGKPALLRRDAARPGDLIGVTGTLGGSAGGLRVLNKALHGADADELKRLHYRPVPRIKEGKALVESGVLCAMDVSDGLVGDIEKICVASEVGAVINAASVPVPIELRTLFGGDATQMALSGGEDYELVFTAPFDLMDRLLSRNPGSSGDQPVFTHIGSVVEEPDEGSRVIVRDASGEQINLRRTGWDHLEPE